MEELTTKEVAAKLGLSVRQVQTLIRRTHLRATKRGRDWFVTPEDLAAFQRRPVGRPRKIVPKI